MIILLVPSRSRLGNPSMIRAYVVALSREALAAKAFQYVTVPQPPVQVCRLTPAMPKAGGIKVDGS